MSVEYPGNGCSCTVTGGRGATGRRPAAKHPVNEAKPEDGSICELDRCASAKVLHSLAQPCSPVEARFMKTLHRLYVLLLISSFGFGFAAAARADVSKHFDRPAELERDIAFWRRIYTEVTTEGGLLHDPEDLSVVYEVLNFPSNISPRQRSNLIKDAKKRYADILDRLARGADDLSKEELRVQALWPKGTRRSRFEQAAEEVRFQLGQADRFREGVVRSGAWRDHIAETFERMGLPRELAALPHVESSFNTYAYSKVGAAGMWQFMRSTGRRFLRIDAEKAREANVSISSKVLRLAQVTRGGPPRQGGGTP